MFEAKFQSFDDAPEPTASAPRVHALRTELARRNLTGFIVPRSDRQQNEYVPPAEERLAWLTGFTGSAGVAVVLMERAVLFTDGRYTLQAREQLDTSLFEIVHLVETPPHEWLERNLTSDDRIGYDPWLHTVEGAERLGRACAAAGADADRGRAQSDRRAMDRPPAAAARPHHAARYPLRRRGGGDQARGAAARDRQAQGRRAGRFRSARGGLDLQHPRLGRRAHAAAAGVRHRSSQRPADALRRRPQILERGAGPARERSPTCASRLTSPAISPRSASTHKTVRLDQATAADALARLITNHGGKVTRGADPTAIMKAVKNSVEIAGARAAHVRDGAAVVRFLAWLDRTRARRRHLTEIEAVEALESFRRDTGLLKDVSFPTIAGAGADGAIVHYRVTRKTNRPLVPGELFLLDSGAQYEDGTTDITRTIAIGAPSEEMRERFTLVLKGHIAIARAVFPDGTTGAQLDSLARQFLWAAGLDFDHGTGHGVGSYLSVHEGPARLSKLGTVALKRGMILSNEPGYYKTGAYGIRIENLVLVTEAAPVAGAEKPLNAFETLTLAPIDRRLVERDC